MKAKLHPNEAAKILGISTGDINPESVKLAYRKACSKYHPDRNPAGLHMMQAINVAYDALRDFTGHVQHTANNYDDSLNAALNVAVTLYGVNIEICGSWVWVTGDTKTNKDALKSAGFRWSGPKKAWYFRPDDFKSRSHGKWSLDDIRSSYGSQAVQGNTRPQLQS